MKSDRCVTKTVTSRDVTRVTDDVTGVTITSRGHCWHIKDAVMAQVDDVDEFDYWPNGSCKLVYSVKVKDAASHQSGWAMRNTNNHDRNVLKKSCLGVMVCGEGCANVPGGGGCGGGGGGVGQGEVAGSEIRPLQPVLVRPFICDKARREQAGGACPTLGCGGKLVHIKCGGHAGKPVTHVWRAQGTNIFFQAKGTHDHPPPERKLSAAERRIMGCLNTYTRHRRSTNKQKGSSLSANNSLTSRRVAKRQRPTGVTRRRQQRGVISLPTNDVHHHLADESHPSAPPPRMTSTFSKNAFNSSDDDATLGRALATLENTQKDDYCYREMTSLLGHGVRPSLDATREGNVYGENKQPNPFPSNFKDDLCYSSNYFDRSRASFYDAATSGLLRESPSTYVAQPSWRRQNFSTPTPLISNGCLSPASVGDNHYAGAPQHFTTSIFPGICSNVSAPTNTLIPPEPPRSASSFHGIKCRNIPAPPASNWTRPQHLAPSPIIPRIKCEISAAPSNNQYPTTLFSAEGHSARAAGGIPPQWADRGSGGIPPLFYHDVTSPSQFSDAMTQNRISQCGSRDIMTSHAIYSNWQQQQHQQQQQHEQQQNMTYGHQLQCSMYCHQERNDRSVWRNNNNSYLTTGVYNH